MKSQFVQHLEAVNAKLTEVTPPRWAVILDAADVRALIAEIERLRAENAAIRAWLCGAINIRDAEIDATLARRKDAPE